MFWRTGPTGGYHREENASMKFEIDSTGNKHKNYYVPESVGIAGFHNGSTQ